MNAISRPYTQNRARRVAGRVDRATAHGHRQRGHRAPSSSTPVDAIRRTSRKLTTAMTVISRNSAHAIADA